MGDGEQRGEGGGRATAWVGSERARGRCLDGNQAHHKEEVVVCGWRPQLLCLAAVLLLLLLNQSRVTRATNSFSVDL